MNLAKLRNRVRLKLSDSRKSKYSDSFIDEILNEGLRVIASETLILEGKDSSLTYSSANDGFAVPSDFFRVKHMEWTTSGGYHPPINPFSIAEIRRMRDYWKDISEDQADSLNPGGYAIDNNYIILDSTTQTSPTLYYYKYDTAMTSDTDSPSINSEYHKYLIDYAGFELEADEACLRRWNYGLKHIISRRRKTGNLRAKYTAL